MATLQAAPASPGRGREREVGETIQAGHSDSNLGAERSSAELQSNASTSIVENASNSTQPRSSSSAPEPGRRSLAQDSRRRRSSCTPAVPSPLNHSSSSSTSSSEDNGDVSPTESSSSDGVPRDQNTGNAPATGKRRKGKGSSTLSPIQKLWRQQSVPALPRETPKTLEDPGRTYSPYSAACMDLPSNSRPLEPSITRSDGSSSVLRSSTADPFNDSKENFEKWGHANDSMSVFHPYSGGENGFILYTHEVEADDKLHMPDKNDGINDKAPLSDHFDRISIGRAIGVFILAAGLICVFIVLPVLTFTTGVMTPSGQW
jgi:hypothetical protein